MPRLEARARKCPGCNGTGWLVDTTYNRTGELIRHERCYGTGLSEEAIRRKLKPFQKPAPKTEAA